MKRMIICAIAMLVAAALLSSCKRQEPKDRAPEIKARAEVKRSAEFNLKKTCFDVGRRIYEADFAKPSPGYLAMSPLYAYSKELNTCVMFAGDIGKNSSGQFIIDTLTNEELGSSIRSGAEIISKPDVKFEQLKKRLFSSDAVGELGDPLGIFTPEEQDKRKSQKKAL
jgi:hypothetical protein